jgi:hypothetical protein
MNKTNNKTNNKYIYKNDLKFNNNFDIENSDWESDMVKDLYENYNKKPKIELRLKDSEMEKYEYLDLSNLSLTTELFHNLMELDKIKNILKKICFLDLSENDLNIFPNLNMYPNIIYLNIGHNNIKGIINNNNLIELSCEFNKITKINSLSITKLSAGNNLIEQITVPKIKVLIINNNNLTEIGEYENLEYFECIDNKINTISNLFNLEELYIANNNLNSISGMFNLLIFNCANNPIKKINYFEKMKLIVCSTPLLSSKYNVNNISKIKKEYFIELKQNENDASK